jgi:hypothetical protein
LGRLEAFYIRPLNGPLYQCQIIEEGNGAFGGMRIDREN